MIKLFRRIRYSLVEQNKTTRYFKYAIGEIFLVVIGILIAENLTPPEASGLKPACRTGRGGFSSLEQKRIKSYKLRAGSL